ncbi:MAG: malto-oligosyltrehalose trehalohydrolase [Isosphaeraceae bacterium]
MINDPLAPDVGLMALDESHVLWRVWASQSEQVELVQDPGGAEVVRTTMEPEGRGYFRCVTARPAKGSRYAYSLGGGPPLPDPCSRWQPDGFQAPSAVVFPEEFPWEDRAWKGIERKDLVVYELHVGTFTKEGTFDAVIPRIDALRELGVTALELMPVGQFPGRQSWGYDGVHPFAVQNTYGGPEGLQRLIDACHRKGMAVVLDVVYNHFGPDGNVFPLFGDYLTEKYRTDWGPAINYDARGCDSVRAMVLQNVRMWVRDYHLDGLRLDAADQIYDRSPRHILSEVVEVAHEEADRLGRRAHIFAETDLNDAPRFLNPLDLGGYACDGHWNDDFHHALHVVLTGETNGYYQDFAEGPEALAKAFQEVFVNNGNFSPFRGRRHGASAKEFSGDRFVVFSQNHDQVGNRLRSDRYAATLPASALRLAAGLVLLSPRIPLLFMGEEYGETNPFPFFCDLQAPELVEAVRKGRQDEFAYFGGNEERIDPFARTTRESAVLTWNWDEPARAGLRQLYQDLLRLRREIPELRDHGPVQTRLHGESKTAQVLEVIFQAGPEDVPPRTILFNLGDSACPYPAHHDGRPATFRSEVAAYGAVSVLQSEQTSQLNPHEFVMFGPSDHR